MHEKLIQFFMHDLILELYVRLIKRTYSSGLQDLTDVEQHDTSRWRLFRICLK